MAEGSTVSVKLSKELTVKVAVVAALKGLPKSAVVQACFEEYVDGYTAEDLANLDIFPEPTPRGKGKGSPTE